MQYTLRAFIGGKDEELLDEICRVFSSMERSAYNLLRDENKKNAAQIKSILYDRYGIKNARWKQSALDQARAIRDSQKEGIKYKIELYKENIKNTNDKIKLLSNDELKISGCKAKVEKLSKRIDELKEQLNEESYPRAVFGSSKLFHQLSIADGTTMRRDDLRKEWKEKRSNHFFSVGQANQRGNANTRIIFENAGEFYLEIRNWFEEQDFKLLLNVPDYAKKILAQAIQTAESVKLGMKGELLVENKGLPYSVRVIKSSNGYQVFVSFELEESLIKWSGRLAGIDINPEGIACTIVSKDGNLIATRFFKDNRLISASKNKRKWVLENLINKILNFCLHNYNCNIIAVENLKFKGAYDRDSRINYKLSNFMKKKMIEKIKLDALRMNMLTLDVDPAYTSKVAVLKYGRQFGGFNRHQLAAFVIARRALGYKESPTRVCLPKTKKEKWVWNYCMKKRNYGYQSRIQTLLQHEPMDRKSARTENGEEAVTKLLKARSASTSAKGLRSHDAPANNRARAVEIIAMSGRQAGSVRPNRHAIGGDGATGHRVSPAPLGVANFYVRKDMI